MSRMNLNNLVSGRQQRPLRIVIHGVDGIGKSTFSASAPDPIFLCAEDGTAHLDVTRFPQPENWKDIMDAFSTLYEAEHSFKTLILDSVDWAEQIARDAVCVEQNVPSIESIPYGRGWVFCNDKMRQLISCLDAIYMKGMNIIVIAHSYIKPFNDPELSATIDRYALKLDKRTDPLFREWADYVLFANWDTRIEQATDTKGKPLPGLEGKAKGRSYGKRLLYTQRSAAFDAKRRFNIPDRMELDWGTFWSAHNDAANSPTIAN